MRARPLFILAFVLPLLVAASVWAPDVWHYYVPVPSVSDDAVRAARLAPAQGILDEIGEYRSLSPWLGTLDRVQVIREADSVMQGELAMGGPQAVRFGRPFDRDDLTRDSGAWMLHYAAFAIPDRLIKAYHLTGNDAYLKRALEFVLAFKQYEDSAWLPRGHLWNDHAIAERVFVLVDIWGAYRNYAGYDPAVGQKIVQLLDRYGAFLAKPSHFTVNTNHGVIQNLALLQVGTALAAMPGSREFVAVAVERILAQMAFYLSPEGPVLEHSAGYHSFGLELTGMLIRGLALNNIPVPPELQAKYQRALAFYAVLRAPDGSLPMIGDTYYGGDKLGPPVVAGAPAGLDGKLEPRTGWRPDRPFSVFPVSGYAVWWNGLDAWPSAPALSQLAVTWSHFPGHGHKRPDELSVLFWGHGQTWWTNSGYWTSDSPGWQAANSWEGSNGPHLEGEGLSSVRSTKFNGFGSGNGVAALDIERDGPGPLRIRRQVIQAAPNLWVVLTQATGNGKSTVASTWTTLPEVSVDAGPRANAFRLTAPKTASALDVSFSGSPDFSIQRRKGSTDPFAGWVFMQGAGRPASSFVVDQRADGGWSAVIWSMAESGKPFTFPKAPSVDWTDAEHWALQIEAGVAATAIARQGSLMTVGDTRILLEAPDTITPQQRVLHEAFDSAKVRYPKYRDYLPYRFKISYLLLLAFGLQILCTVVVVRKLPAYAWALNAAAVCAWIGIGIWLHAVYFTG